MAEAPRGGSESGTGQMGPSGASAAPAQPRLGPPIPLRLALNVALSGKKVDRKRDRGAIERGDGEEWSSMDCSWGNAHARSQGCGGGRRWIPMGSFWVERGREGGVEGEGEGMDGGGAGGGRGGWMSKREDMILMSCTGLQNSQGPLFISARVPTLSFQSLH